MNAFESIKKSSTTNINSNINELNNIKVGDMIVFSINEMEFKGYINDIINNKYVINGNFPNNIKHVSIDFDQITEHYPKNLQFNTKILEEDKIYQDKSTISNDNKNVVFFPDNMKQKEIDKLLPNYNEAKYFIVDKNNETHIVRIKDGFDIKPFVESVIKHLLKSNLIKENIKLMKIIGNNSFCIIKNSPPKTNSLIKNTLKNILK